MATKPPVMTRLAPILIFAILLGCNTESDLPSPIDQNASLAEFREISVNPGELFFHEGNEEATASNEIRYQTAQRFLPQLRTKSVCKDIIETIKTTGRDFVSINRLLEEGILTASESLNTSNPTYFYQGEEYQTVIRVPNIDAADSQLPPVVSPAIEVDDAPAEDAIDHIFAWYATDEGVREVSVGEQQGTTMVTPLFIFTPFPVGNIPDVDASSNDSDTSDGLVEFRADDELVISTFQVKNPNFFEKTGGLEYRVRLFVGQPTGTTAPVDNAISGYIRRDTEGNFGVRRRDVRNSRTFNPNRVTGAYAFGLPGSSLLFGGHDVFIVAWEMDWFGADQTVGAICTGTGCNQTTYSSSTFNMAFPSEWFNRIAVDGNAAFSSSGASVTENISRARLTVSRNF